MAGKLNLARTMAGKLNMVRPTMVDNMANTMVDKLNTA